MKIEAEKIKILLVEDAAVMRKMELKTLKALGFSNVIEAKHGRAAVEVLEQNVSVDLIISDWNMLEMDGFELLVWVRKQAQYKSIPFLMATAQGDKAQEKKALNAGVSAFVAKPFAGDELLQKIGEALGEEKEATAKPVREKQTASGRLKLKVAHIQITDHIILGVLKHLIEKGDITPKHFELETACMPGWNPVQQALEDGSVDAAFVLAPIAMDLFAYGVPIKLTLLAHKNGSIFVRNKTGAYAHPHEEFFRNKSFLIPHKMSIHHMLAHLFFSRIGLKPGMAGQGESDVTFEVAAPIKMQEFLQKNADTAGFMVAEPLGTKAIAAGAAELQFLSSRLWPEHPCCVVAMRDDVIDQYSDAVYEFTQMLVDAGTFVERKPEAAAEIGVTFLDPQKKLGLKVPIMKNVLTEPQGIKTADLFPDIKQLFKINDYMCNEMGIGTAIDMEKFVDTRFAETACPDRAVSHSRAELNDSVQAAMEILTPDLQKAEDTNKMMLDMEGKYLMFCMGEQEYGIDILNIREIIGTQPVRSIPQSPDYVKGVTTLRDKVILVMDLKEKFGMGAMEKHPRNCIIVLQSGQNGNAQRLGIAVDSVSEVLGIKSTDIEAVPYLGLAADAGAVCAMAKVGDGVKLLLDTVRIADTGSLNQLPV